MLELNRTMAPIADRYPFGTRSSLMAKVDLDASSSELLGTEIGPYRLVRRLGMGGMAETFVAIRRGPGDFTQRVCLKLVLPFFRDDEEFVSLFQREARLAAKLRHSNIVGVIDFGEIGGRSYMALELVDGVDLQALLDAESGKRLSPEYVALIGHDLAAALDHAHNPPRESDFDGSFGGAIVHRDISPSNVLISRHGEILLTDFGVAKAVSGSSRKHSAVKGKIPYMSPEQLRLESLDGRADLFGVGVVLFEALCGRRPYEGGHDPATIMLILQGDHPPLTSLAPGAPPELCALIERLIDPDRDSRPDSAAELIDLLDPFVPSPRSRRRLAKRIAELRPEEDGTGSSYPPAAGSATTERQDSLTHEEREKGTSGIVDAGQSEPKVEPWVEGADPTTARDTDRGSIEPPPIRRRRGLLAALIAAALIVGAVVAWRSTTAPGTTPAPIEADAEVVADVTPNDTDDARGASTPETSPPATTVEPQSEPSAVRDDSAGPARADARSPGAEPETIVEAPAPKTKKKRVDPAAAPARLTVVVYPWGDVWINGRPRGPAPLKNVSLKPGRYRISAGQGKPAVTKTIRLRAGDQQKIKLDVTK